MSVVLNHPPLRPSLSLSYSHFFLPVAPMHSLFFSYFAQVFFVVCSHFLHLASFFVLLCFIFHCLAISAICHYSLYHSDHVKVSSINIQYVPKGLLHGIIILNRNSKNTAFDNDKVLYPTYLLLYYNKTLKFNASHVQGYCWFSLAILFMRKYIAQWI